MYVVLLRFADNRAAAGEQLAGHNAWIDAGFADGIFLAVGSLAGGAGGAVLAHGESRAALEARVATDPFVAHGVVDAEIVEFTPARTDARLDFVAA